MTMKNPRIKSSSEKTMHIVILVKKYYNYFKVYDISAFIFCLVNGIRKKILCVKCLHE